MHVEVLGGEHFRVFSGSPVQSVAMAERQEVGSSEGTPAADTYPRKILEYMEGFLISKVTYT